MTIATLNFPNNPVLLHFREELHKNPATFETTRNLYYVAALVSSVIAVVFFGSTLFLQTTILPFWAAIAGSTVAVYAGHAFVGLVGKMMENAKEADKAAACLKEMQVTYRNYQKAFFSEPEKIIMAYGNLADREYLEAEQRLQKMTENTLDPKFKTISESTLKEIIQLQHQVLILKIDLSFKIAIYDAIATDNINCLTKKEDLLMLSGQDLLKRNCIEGLNELLKNKFTDPLIFFNKRIDPSKCENLSYKEVQEMHPEELANHMFTLMKAPITELI
ncbi:MAG: hypothetical protein ACRDDW_05505 [Candidatus Rhabdochlamydia sp.]